MATEKIAQKRWVYTLFRLDDGTLILSVLCGGAGMYELNIPLDDEVASRVIVDEKFMEEYASDIRSHPEQYAHRSVPM